MLKKVVRVLRRRTEKKILSRGADIGGVQLLKRGRATPTGREKHGGKEGKKNPGVMKT